jgi:hypothetical protein
MGLDMYVYTTPVKPSSPVGFEIPELIDALYNGITIEVDHIRELHYWRKHWSLHTVMEQLYLEKGGADEGFNCVNLQLIDSDLEYIEKAVNLGLEVYPYYPHNTKAIDLEFIEKAKKASLEGLTVYYYAWY